MAIPKCAPAKPAVLTLRLLMIARALSHDPDVIIADEPTGSLDSETEKEVLKILTSLAHDEGKCVIIVTHSLDVARQVDVIYSLKNGNLNID